MATWQAIRALIDAFGADAGTRRPVAAADLPRVVVAASDVTEELVGLGGLAGARAVAADRWATSGGVRAAGLIDIELWGASEADVMDLADAVFAVVDDATALAAAGFMRLSPRAVGPVSQAFLGTTDDAALLMPLSCAFVFEAVAVEEEGPGGIIRRVHVDVHDFDEAIDLT